MKRLLIINQDAGYLTIDVANAFKDDYDEVVLICGKLKVYDRKLKDGIKVIKTVQYNRKNLISRSLTWILCFIHLFFLIALRFRNYTILYYSNPPISYFNSLFFKNKYSIVIFDLYPDALLLKNITQNSVIYKIWSKLNRKVFKNAEKIITLSDAMRQQLLSYVESEKIEVIPIWTALENCKPIAKENNIFITQLGLLNNFVILYSGNMGIGHQLEIIIELARELKQESDIIFLFVGDGAKKSKLQGMVDEYKLSNVNFLPWQNNAMLPYSLAAADIAIVSQEPEVSHSSVPSKTFNYMAAGAPILGIGNRKSELYNLIMNFQNGHFFCLDDVQEGLNQTKDFILACKKDKKILKDLSDRSLKAARNFTFELAKSYLF
jgi:glycosyltransferase involved in cell wall biosynthesis